MAGIIRTDTFKGPTTKTPTTMSSVNNVTITTSKPDNAQPDPSGVKQSGSSNGGFSFTGVISGAQAKVVIYCGQQMASASKNSTGDGAVVVLGSGGNYLVLTLGQVDEKNWTVRIRTDKDSPGTGTTFQGGTGGGDM